MVVSIKNLASANFQEIRKKIRDKTDIKVYKKAIMIRAIEKIEKGVIKELKNYIVEDSALMFSKIDPFELSGILADNRTAAKAKVGQEAPEDIIVKAGSTELVPGPAISQLGSLGLKIAVEEGKIAIKEDKIIVKKGNKINANAADIMGKLDIKPFKIGFEPLAAYDIKEDKFYKDIKVDKEKSLEALKQAYGRGFAFAFKLGYVCKETLRLLLGKANAEEKAIAGLINAKQNIQEAK